MDAALAPGRELEVFERIRHITAPPVDPGLLQRAIQQLPRRTDKRVCGDILLVARLFADEDDVRSFRPLAENKVGRVAVEVAAGAAFCNILRLLERPGRFAARVEGRALL